MPMRDLRVTNVGPFDAPAYQAQRPTGDKAPSHCRTQPRHQDGESQAIVIGGFLHIPADLVVD